MAAWFRRLLARIRYRHFDADLAEEIETHRALAQDALEAAGSSREDASREASRVLGNVTLTREDARRVWIAGWLEDLLQDARYAIVAARRRPAFGIGVIAILALGLGLVTVVFSVAYATFLRPWQVPEGDSVVIIRSQPATSQLDSRTMSIAEFRYVQARVQSLSAMFFSARSGDEDVADGAKVLGDAAILYVTSSYFGALQLDMIAGRAFTADEDDPGAPRALAIVGQRFWRQQFGAAPTVVGRDVRIGKITYTILGVASVPSFVDYAGTRYDIALPLGAMTLSGRATPADFLDPRYATPVDTIGGRLRPDSTEAAANAELTVLSRQFRDAEHLPALNMFVVDTRPLSTVGTGGKWQVAQLVLGGALLVLLLACANVGNMLLARSFTRQREIAVRLALGAGRARITRQLLTESVVLVIPAGLIALGMAYAVPAVVERLPRDAFARPEFYVPNATVMLFAFGMAIVTMLACGLAPALRGSRVSLATQTTDRSDRAPGALPLRRLLLAFQVALATVLLVAAGLLTRATSHALAIDPGFRLHELDAMSFRLPPDAAMARRTAFHQALFETLTAEDRGQATFADEPPLARNSWGIFVRPSERPDAKIQIFRLQGITSNFFDVMGVRLVEGRPPAEAAGKRELVVSESVARQLWPGEDPIGKILLEGMQSTKITTREIVGVAADISVNSLGTTEPLVYQYTSYVRPTLLVRDTTPALMARLQAAATSLEPNVVITTRPLVENARESLTGAVLGSRVAWSIGALALLLATMGAFGVYAYAVEERRREIGIRMALGARAWHVIRAVLQTTLTTAVAGAGVGFVAALGAARLLRSYLYGLSPVDPAAYAMIALILVGAAILASWIPTRRAVRVDPVSTLRCE